MSSTGASASAEDASITSLASAASNASLRPRSPSVVPADGSSAADSHRLSTRVENEQHSLNAPPHSTLLCDSMLAALPLLNKHQLRRLMEATQECLLDDAAAKPPRGSPITALAKVELQLIMHGCDRVSLIALARCCRTILAAASSDFAWRCLSPMRICSSVPDLGQKLSTSLLRFVDVCLWLGQTQSAFTPPALGMSVSAADIASITSTPRLRGLDCSRCILSSAEMQRLFSRSWCTQLTELHCRSMTPAELNMLTERLPQLRILNAFISLHDSYVHPADLASLAQLQDLTELRLNGDAGVDWSTVAVCRHLHTLSLGGAISTGHALLSAPSLQSLRTLELVCASHAALSHVSAWRAAFSNLRALDTLLLVIHRFSSIGALLTVAADHCAPLRTFHLRVVGVDALERSPADLEQPLMPLLRCALTQRAHLRVLMDLLSRDAVLSMYGPSCHLSSIVWFGRMDALQAAFTQLAGEFAGRVKIILRGAE